ncbi:MAG TPA: glycosyltransferase family 2 protein [Polyangiales bacterium]|nr:glycosyltransferase family 2 protein [Polyangiales bacterium]
MVSHSRTDELPSEPVVAFADGYALLVVIVNYRTARLTIENLRALQPEVRERGDTRVVVVDNDSGDDSVDQIGSAIASEGWSDWVLLVPSKHNGGYAWGNNLPIRASLRARRPPSYFHLLNPDAQVRPGALTALVDFFAKNPRAGIAGSLLENADGSDWRTAFRFPTLLGELESGVRLGPVSKLLGKWVVAREMNGVSPEQVDWLPGASMMVRRETLEAVGLMDDAYFLYYEETDFCLQAKRAGWECWYVPQSRVMHIAGQSTGVTVRTNTPKRMPKYVFDSRRRYFVKNHGKLYAAAADAAFIAGYATWRVRRKLQGRPDSDPPHLLIDSVRNSTLLNFKDHTD